jgi:hypothetical protein
MIIIITVIIITVIMVIIIVIMVIIIVIMVIIIVIMVIIIIIIAITTINPVCLRTGPQFTLRRCPQTVLSIASSFIFCKLLVFNFDILHQNLSGRTHASRIRIETGTSKIRSSSASNSTEIGQCIAVSMMTPEELTRGVGRDEI